MGFIFAFFVLCLIINSNILSVFVNASKVFTTLMALVINLQSEVETFQEALSLVKLMPIFASFLFSINTLSASRWLKQDFNRGRLLLFFFLWEKKNFLVLAVYIFASLRDMSQGGWSGESFHCFSSMNIKKEKSTLEFYRNWNILLFFRSVFVVSQYRTTQLHKSIGIKKMYST